MALYPIDMRSDTATKPTAGMREAIAHATVGDDMLSEDPTVNLLEAMCADLLGKEAAVFACSGTQSNQMAVWAHCAPGDELLIEATSHLANYEAGGPAVLSGVTCRAIEGRHGMLDASDLEGKMRASSQHVCPTRLVCLENTTNVGGGRCYSMQSLEGVRAWAQDRKIKVHLDGARLFNAVIATRRTAADICQNTDTVSVCFSKGLGCPMGSVLAGSRADIAKARRARKLFGGALRQAGIVAAAAIYALRNHVERLEVDHANAKAFAEAISRIDGIVIDPLDVQTNLVFFCVHPDFGSAGQLSAKLREHEILINATGAHRLRACTHLDVDRKAVTVASAAIARCMHEGLGRNAEPPAGGYLER